MGVPAEPLSEREQAEFIEELHQDLRILGMNPTICDELMERCDGDLKLFLEICSHFGWGEVVIIGLNRFDMTKPDPPSCFDDREKFLSLQQCIMNCENDSCDFALEAAVRDWIRQMLE